VVYAVDTLGADVRDALAQCRGLVDPKSEHCRYAFSAQRGRKKNPLRNAQKVLVALFIKLKYPSVEQSVLQQVTGLPNTTLRREVRAILQGYKNERQLRSEVGFSWLAKIGDSEASHMLLYLLILTVMDEIRHDVSTMEKFTHSYGYHTD